MSYPNTTTAIADINGNYNISGGSSTPDPIQLGTINPITGSSTVYLENGELGPIDFDVKGQRTNQEVALFCNDNTDEFLLGTGEGDIGIYYGLTNISVPSGLFCIGEKGQTSDIKISDSAITFYKAVNFTVPTNFIEEVSNTINGTFSGIFGVGVSYTVPVRFKIHKNVVFMNIEAVIHNMPIASGFISSNPFIPPSYVNSSNVPRAMLCAGIDIGGPKVCNVGLTLDGISGNYYISVYPLSTGNFTGGANTGFEQINVSWQK